MVVFVDVLVLGAGLSGMSLARRLFDSSVDVLVVEARSDLGGRLQQGSFSDGTKIEIGANWVHGTTGSRGRNNPMWDLVQEAGLSGAITDWDSMELFYEDGSRVEENDQRWDAIEKAEECVERLANVKYREALRGEQSTSLSYKAALRMCGWEAQNVVDDALEWSTIDYSYALNAQGVSLLAANSYNWPDWREVDFMVADPRGYVETVRKLAEPLDSSKIHLETKVVEIDYRNSRRPTVRAVGPSGEEVVYKANYVVVTFSLGVLQQSLLGSPIAPKFTPTLPAWKREALHSMEMGHYTKFFLRFDSQFWENAVVISIARTDREAFPSFQNLNTVPGMEGKNILLATLTGESSRISATLSEAELVEKAMESLRLVYPSAPNPVETQVSRWSADELTFGSYSTLGPGAMPWVPALVGEPVGNVFFAGEAADPIHFGSAHGAVRSGRYVASQILKCKKNKRACKPFNERAFLKKFRQQFG